MRIYEIAKEIGVSSATVVKWANERGIDATSPISKVSGVDAETLRKAASGNSEISDLKSKREAKAARAAELSKKRSSADKEALAAQEEADKKAAEEARKNSRFGGFKVKDNGTKNVKTEASEKDNGAEEKTDSDENGEN